MKKREAFRLTLFEKSLLSFKEGLERQGATEWKINVVIHRFMLCFHQAVGALYHFVPLFCVPKDDAVETHAALAATQGWLINTELWVEMRDNRNLAAHPYLEDESQEIYARCMLYYKEMEHFHTKMCEIVEL